jgi:hypothetical protein
MYEHLLGQQHPRTLNIRKLMSDLVQAREHAGEGEQQPGEDL